MRNSIKARVRTVILITSLIVLALTVAAFAAYEIARYRSDLVRGVKTLAAVIADNSTAALAFGGADTAADILAALKAEPDITMAALYDADGAVFATYPAAIKPSATPPPKYSEEHKFHAASFELYRPVVQEGKTIGALYLQSSLRGMYQRLGRYTIIAAAVLCGSIVAAVALSNLLQQRITGPILALTAGAHEIASRGDYSVRVAKQTTDELGQLTDTFNQMVEKIQEHQARLLEQAQLLNLSHDAIIVRKGADEISFWNRGAVEMYGFSEGEALGRSLSELLKTEFPEPPERIARRLAESGRWDGELAHTRKDGRKIYVASRWSLVRGSDGREQSVLESNTDVTERRAFQAELERLVQERTAKLQETIGELEAFSYSVSHDMRSPLRAMQGYARALLKEFETKLDANAVHYLNRIVRASNRLDLLIQDVLAYSKVAKGDIGLAVVDLAQIVRDVIANEPQLQEPNARVVIREPLHKVVGHEAYLTQCVTNLLGNAVKFAREGVVPEAIVSSEKVGERVRVWFEDNGIGIAPEHQARIFDIFGRVYPEKKYSGTGIGLAIVRKAVQRMNGEVGVESELGKGSRFWILLHAEDRL